jgi:hypothetical protein
MSRKLKPGHFATVIEGKKKPDTGDSNIRECPSTDAKKKGKIAVGGVVTILDPRPEWTKEYPYDDGTYEWLYVLGHNGLEGWMAARRGKKVPYLKHKAPRLDPKCERIVG